MKFQHCYFGIRKHLTISPNIYSLFCCKSRSTIHISHVTVNSVGYKHNAKKTQVGPRDTYLIVSTGIIYISDYLRNCFCITI